METTCKEDPMDSRDLDSNPINLDSSNPINLDSNNPINRILMGTTIMEMENEDDT